MVGTWKYRAASNEPSFLCPAYLGGDKLGKLLGVPQVGICEARMDTGKELGKGICG